MDDYVLKYIPVMTDEGKLAHFGEQTEEDESFDPCAIEEEKHKEYLTLINALSKDNSLNNALEKLMGDENKPPKFEDFKKRLVRVIAKTNLTRQDIHEKHQKSTTTRVKADVNSMRQSMEKINFSEEYKNYLQEVIQEQLLNQKTYSDPFIALCDAGNIVDFLENISPLMKRAANDVYEQTQRISGRNTKKIDSKEEQLKQDFANKLALGVHHWLGIKVSGTHETEFPTAFGQFFAFCCQMAGFDKTSNKSNQAQKAVKFLKTHTPNQDSKNQI